MISAATLGEDAVKRVPVLYLDLDGTVREGKDDALGRFVNGPEDVRVFPAALERMRQWKAKGGRIIGVSNQGGVALGIVSLEKVWAAIEETDRQTDRLFDDISVCCHHPDAQAPEDARCWCRKPAPGLAIEAVTLLRTRHPAETYPVPQALFVGDRPEDQGCAEALNVDFMWAAPWRAGA